MRQGVLRVATTAREVRLPCEPVAAFPDTPGKTCPIVDSYPAVVGSHQAARTGLFRLTVPLLLGPLNPLAPVGRFRRVSARAILRGTSAGVRESSGSGCGAGATGDGRLALRSERLATGLAGTPAHRAAGRGGACGLAPPNLAIAPPTHACTQQWQRIGVVSGWMPHQYHESAVTAACFPAIRDCKHVSERPWRGLWHLLVCHVEGGQHFTDLARETRQSATWVRGRCNKAAMQVQRWLRAGGRPEALPQRAGGVRKGLSMAEQPQDASAGTDEETIAREALEQVVEAGGVGGPPAPDGA